MELSLEELLKFVAEHKDQNFEISSCFTRLAAQCAR